MGLILILFMKNCSFFCLALTIISSLKAIWLERELILIYVFSYYRTINNIITFHWYFLSWISPSTIVFFKYFKSVLNILLSNLHFVLHEFFKILNLISKRISGKNQSLILKLNRINTALFYQLYELFNNILSLK